MSRAPEPQFISTMHDTLAELRKGNAELLAQRIENGRGVISLHSMHPDDRARFARLVRTGDPLTRGEKRQNNLECKYRDAFMVTRILYWLGNGLPGFSNTALDSAFHRAIEDYENNIIQGAPSRTPESLYRHVWKPYLSRAQSGNTTYEDVHLIQSDSLSEFLLGLKRSNPGQHEALAQLTWFHKEFMRNGDYFYLRKMRILDLRNLLLVAGIQPEEWRHQLRVSLATDRVIDEILFG